MDSSGNNFVYLAAVYDYGPAGDLENGGIKYPISLSVPVQKRECTENDRPDGTSSQCLRNNQYLRCVQNKCQPGPCSFNSECANNYCCTADPNLPDNLKEKDPLTGNLKGTCTTVGTTKQPYLCTRQ